jgi:hypothetical protein
MRRLLAAASIVSLMLSLTVGSPATADPPESPSAYDTFDAVTVNTESPAGTEVPYTGTEELYVVTPAFDTSGFTVQPGESNTGSSNRNGCVLGEGAAAYAGRTAWVRFDPDVDGQLLVRALTPGYDSVLVLYRITDRPWGQVDDLSLLTSIDCSASRVGPGNEAVGACFTDGEVPCLQAEAGFAYYAQVGGLCPSSTDPTTCSDPAVPGGSTRIEIRFVPDDSDGDGVADTADDCPGTASGTQVNSAGCPDQDGDEVADADDECPTLAGNPQPPYDGCPEGPVPPDGQVGVVIVSDSGDTFTTRDATVRLGLVWPQGATHFIASNNGRDYSAPQPVAQSVPWTLQPSDAAVTRLVFVKFLGEVFDPDNVYPSAILLDPDAPRKREGLVARTWDGRFAVRLRLNDGAEGSGVRTLRLGGRTFTCRPISSPACRDYRLQRQFEAAVRSFKAVDYAGNPLTQSLKRVLCPKDGQLPVYPYPKYRGNVPYGCFRVGQQITRKAKRKFDFPSVNLRTAKVRPGVFRVRKA